MRKSALHILTLCLLFTVFGWQITDAQPFTANFYITDLSGNRITGGCSPLLFRVNDSSYANGAPIVFRRILNSDPYDSHTYTGLGNNPITLRNPVYGFVQSGVDTICLRATPDNSIFQTVCKTITVFEQPVVKLGSDVTSGCNPLTVQFYDSSTVAGGDSIVAWEWDFCDGALSYAKNPVHTFTLIPGMTTNCFCVTLTVTSSKGCKSTKKYDNYICLDRPPVANFFAPNQTVCDSPFVVNFTNTSYSPSNPPNPLSYIWYFGDSTTSNDTNPQHVYTSVGSFPVKLVVHDTDCNLWDSITKSSYIKTINLKANFSVSKTTICTNTSVSFTNLTTGIPPNLTPIWSWDFGDNTTSPTENPTHTYQNPGVYTVSLHVGITGQPTCFDDTVITSLITVNPRPDANFVADTLSSCSAPLDVQFTDLSLGNPVSWSWRFGDPPLGSDTSTLQSPSHTYATTGSFTVRLTVTNSFGCSNIETKSGYITISNRTATFDIDSVEGCAPRTVDFTDRSMQPVGDPIIWWEWDFGDGTQIAGNNAASQNPSHDYLTAGTDTVCFTITFQSGCKATKCRFVKNGAPLEASFDVFPPIVCVNEEITLIDRTDYLGIDTNLVDRKWFLDGTQIPPYSYVPDEPGTYEIKLELSYNGCFDDTTIEITVNDPKADFTFEKDCAFPGRVVFTDKSTSGDSWIWRFGDGPPEGTSNLQSPVYTYLSSGNYNVTLIVTDSQTGCTDSITKEISVSRVIADFSAAPLRACLNEQVSFSDLSIGQNLHYRWDFGDNSPMGTDQNPKHAYTNADTFTVTLTVTDNVCTSTKTKANYIIVTGVYPDFDAPRKVGCMPPTGPPGLTPSITFNEHSSASNGTSIVQWDWNFGGPPAATPPSISYNNSTPPPSSVTTTYTGAGLYTVKLTVTNDQGCSATKTRSNYIDINKPKANFSLPYNLYCVDQPITFNNTSTAPPFASVTWDFGDGSPPSTAMNPTHAYSTIGSFDVSLAVVDQIGCFDDTVVLHAVTTRNTEICVSGDDTFDVCPPHTVCFTDSCNFDTVGIASIFWDFGDGSVSNLKSPCHVYVRAGRFTVTAVIVYANQCVDTVRFLRYIHVGGATGSIVAEPDTGCVPLDVLFDSQSDSSAVTHLWAPGDGNFYIRDQEDTLSFTYIFPGSYLPWVILSDTQHPVCSWTLYADYPVLVDSVITDFSVDLDTVCRGSPVHFTDLSSAYISDSMVRWVWDFGDSAILDDTIANPVHFYNDVTGNITVTLTAYNSFDCSSSKSLNIFVRDKPTSLYTISDSTGCDSLLVTFNNMSFQGSDAPITAYAWNFDTTANSGNTSVLQNPPPHFYSDTGRYITSLAVVDANQCADTSYKQIDIYRSPAGILDADTVNICFGDTTTLHGETGHVSYTWTPSYGLSNDTIAQPLAFPDSTVTYSLLSIETHGCETLDSVTVNVIPLPPLTVTPHPDTAICLGDTVQLLAVGGFSFIWSPSDSLSGLSNPTISDPIAVPLRTTKFIVVNTGVGGCKSKDSVTIQVNDFRPDFVAARVCLGSTTNYIDISQPSDRPITQWFWNFGDGPDSNSTIKDPSHLYANSGTYQVMMVVMDAIGCTDTLVKPAIVDHPPDPKAWQDTFICFGDSIQIFSSGGDTVYWTPDDLSIRDRFTYNPIVTPTSTTVYVAHLTNGVCPFETASVRVQVVPTPYVQTIEDATILMGTSIQLTTTSSVIDSIIWSPPDSLSCFDCLSPFAGPDRETKYTITVFDEYGCFNSDDVTIDVTTRCTDDLVFVPSAFTPNGDDVNDKVFARPFGARTIKFFRVFDRWGRIMFETDDPSIGWEGTDQSGRKLNSGVYVYVVEADCFDGGTIVKTGNITLIK